MNTNTSFDIIVIGAGSGGLNIAGFMNQAGFRTLLIDKKDESIGGDCLNSGCVPSKALIHVATLVESARQAKTFGIQTEEHIDMTAIMRSIKNKQNVIRKHENAEYFRSKGMTVKLGEASFTGANEVSVNGHIYTGKKIIIATGSRPRTLTLPGMEHTQVFNNENIFDIDFLPKKMVFIGGGPINFELGQAFQSLGSEVTIISKSDTFLSKEDPEITSVLIERLNESGIRMYRSAKPTHIENSHLIIETKAGKEVSVPFDALFVGIGRVLNTEGLALEKAGIEMEGEKIKVNEYLETTNPHVYLCGDVAGGPQFTHVAELHASTIIKNFFTPSLLKKKLDLSKLSWVTYTDPQIATFGMSEKQLRAEDRSFEVLSSSFEDDDRAIIDSYRFGKVKIFISPKGTLLGGSMVAPQAGELFQELVLAQSSDISIKKLFEKIYPYPTASRINKKLIAPYFKRQLTPFSKKILRFLYH